MNKDLKIRNANYTFIFDNNLEWQKYESTNFIFYHLGKGPVKKDIELIAEKREKALKYITDFLEIRIEDKFTIYILPNHKIGKTLNLPMNCSVPHEKVACIVYDDFPLCREKIAYGHEIVHLVVYYWDKEIYHIEFLEEGLATYLDMSGSNYHNNFLKKIQCKIGRMDM